VAPTAEEDAEGRPDGENEIQHELMVVTWRKVASTDERLCDRKLLILGGHRLSATDRHSIADMPCDVTTHPAL